MTKATTRMTATRITGERIQGRHLKKQCGCCGREVHVHRTGLCPDCRSLYPEMARA